MTIRTHGIAECEVDQVAISARPRQCIYCPALIVWMTTYYDGRQFAFDAWPAPRRYGDLTGWFPGRFPVLGNLQTVLAPLHLHPPARRQRISHVMHLHRCASGVRQAAA